METKSGESLRVLLRLLIDETDEDLSRSGTGSRSRSVQKSSLPGDAASFWVRRKGFSKGNRGVEGSSKVELA